MLAVLLVGVYGARAAAQSGTSAARAGLAHAQPGDRLRFQLLGMVGERPDTLVVDDRGRVPLPSLGLVDIGAWPIAELADSLTARYAQLYKAPAVEVAVQRRITVEGEVARPDVYYVDLSTTLRDVIARAGGLSTSANPHRVWIIRNGARTAVPDWQSEDARVWDLVSGDQVMVGRRSWLALNAIAAVSAAAVLFSVVYSVTR